MCNIFQNILYSDIYLLNVIEPAMSSKKQIIIDPNSLSGSQTNATHNVTMKRQRKVKPPVALLSPSTVKKNLLEKIKDYKRRNEETPSQDQPQQQQKSDKDLANQFKMSSNYLEQLMNKKKEARKHNHSHHKPKTPSASTPTTMQPMQPIQPMVQQSMQQSMQPMQPMMQPVQVSLDLPPELQLNPNPISAFYPNPIVEPMSIATPIPYAEQAPVSIAPTTNAYAEQAQAPVSILPIAHTEPIIISPPSASNTITATPNPIVLKEVPYGCLRNGIKPTYRTYHRELQKPNHMDNNNLHAHLNKTMKKSFTDASSAPNSISINPTPENDAMIQERQRKLRELQERAAANNVNNSSLSHGSSTPSETNHQISQPTKIKNKIKQIITKKYKLGRTPGSNVVSVLIKNNETRRQIQQEHGVLRRESIVEIRKYLHDHGLLKVGSDAPPDVLRNMYETAKLTGDVNNVNKHVLLHNFIATSDNTNDAH